MQHLKNNQRNNNQTQYVKKIYDLAIKNNSKLLVVISPATKAYKDSLPSSDVLFKDLIDLIQKHNINFLNMYDTSIFDNNDFEDWDHLNIKGAEKLTQIITHELQYISNKK